MSHTVKLALAILTFLGVQQSFAMDAPLRKKNLTKPRPTVLDFIKDAFVQKIGKATTDPKLSEQDRFEKIFYWRCELRDLHQTTEEGFKRNHEEARKILEKLPSRLFYYTRLKK